MLMKQVEAFWLAVHFCISGFGHGFSPVKFVAMTTLFGVGPELRGYY